MSSASRSPGPSEPGNEAQRQLDELERVFAALAHASRRHVLLTLRFRGGRMTAGEIAERFACTWPTTSRHLRVLEHAGLVSVERKGRERIYHLEQALLQRVAGDWLHWFGTDSGATGDVPLDDAGPTGSRK